MKYIKLFEAYNEAKINEVINWKLISDVKDMALEYIDEDMTLFIRVKQNSYPNYTTDEILEMIGPAGLYLV